MQFSAVDQAGAIHQCQAAEGTTLMQAIRDSGLEIAAQCGGCCSCATCHIYVDPEWSARLTPPTEEELAMLELATDVRQQSRLSCQVISNEALSGIRITLAPGTVL